MLNADLNITTADLSATNATFSFGDQLTDILLSTPVTDTDSATGTAGINFDELTCPLFTADDTQDTRFEGSLDDLFAAVTLTDADLARAGVDDGTYVAAVIIPPDFTDQLMPNFAFSDGTDSRASTSAVEVYGNQGQQISSSIVRAVVEGVVNQLVRISVALDSVLNTSLNTILANLNLNTLAEIDLSALDPALITEGFENVDASILEPLACLILPDAGNIQLERQPLDEIQARSGFSFIMILLGSAQAIFFAMFTGIFGMHSIYNEQANWTLQRLLVSPMPRAFVLAGKLLGNLVVVATQLSILFISFTTIASLVEGRPTFIWGTNVPALLVVIFAISFFVSGLGVFVVGIAKNSEQVQFFGPMVSITLGTLGGSFGFRLPPEVAQFSPLWWGTEALQQLSTGDINGLTMPLLILFGIGIALFGVGTILFKRRLEL